MSPMRTAAPLVLALLLLPALPAQAQVQAQAEAQGTVPYPLAGEVFYYEGTATAGADAWPVAFAVRVRGPEPALDRLGALRQGYVLETVHSPDGAPRDADALLEDPDAPRALAFHDLVTLELVELRWSSAWADQFGPPLVPTRTTLTSAWAARAFPDPAGPAPLGAFWGRALPAAGAAAVVHEGIGWASAYAFTPQLVELTGIASSGMDFAAGGTGAYAVAFEALERGPGDPAGAHGHRARYVAAWGLQDQLDTTLEFWHAPGLALPVRIAEARAGPGFDVATTVDLVERLPGARPLPWGAPAQPPDFAPETAPLGAWGPADGTAALPYPLRDAAEAVQRDPTLLTLQRMRAAGEPVLVLAVHQQRPGGDPLFPVPESRWWLVLQDGTRELVVESRRPLGAPVALNREVAIRGVHASVGPDLGLVRPRDLPPVAATLGGALRAWERWGASEGAAPNTLVYSLDRQLDGALRATVWAGWVDARTSAEGAALASADRASLLAVDVDGYPRLGAETAWATRYGLAPLEGGTGPVAPAASPVPQGALAPALAAAGVGVAAAAGLAAKLLAPLFTRLDRGALLGHPTRRALLDLVAREPGVHLDAARAALGIGAGSVAHHVALLQRAGLLRVQSAGRFRRLYPADAPALAVARDAALRQPRAAALYQLVRARPGVGLREAARDLGVPPSSLQWHVAQLEAAGLLLRRGRGLHPGEAL